jgi:hypothetical protein
MLMKLGYFDRKVVVISDPHIRKNDSYFLYELFKKFEVEDATRLLVRDPSKFALDDDAFVGHCWPGSSVWPDFF